MATLDWRFDSRIPNVSHALTLTPGPSAAPNRQELVPRGWTAAILIDVGGQSIVAECRAIGFPPKKLTMKSFAAKYTATEFFCQFSEEYTQFATWSKDKVLNKTIIDIVTSKHPTSIVDLGTGNGELLSLFPQVKNRIGIDVSHRMLNMIHDKNIVKIHADIHSIPLHTASVEFVVCRQVLHYCRPAIVLHEANRILCSGGHVLVVQATDCEDVPAEWYAKWKTFKQIKHRQHLTREGIIHHAAEANLEVAMKRCCQVNVGFTWSDLFQKYAAFTRREQSAIVAFFRETPAVIAKLMHLKTDRHHISYSRTFSCLLFRQAHQCRETD